VIKVHELLLLLVAILTVWLITRLARHRRTKVTFKRLENVPAEEWIFGRLDQGGGEDRQRLDLYVHEDTLLLVRVERHINDYLLVDRNRIVARLTVCITPRLLDAPMERSRKGDNRVRKLYYSIKRRKGTL